jgi:hypothetical protein
MYSPFLKASSVLAIELHNVLEENIIKPVNKFDCISPYSIAQLKDKKKNFMSVFIAETGVLPLYIISPKEGYDVDRIVSDGACLFPNTLPNKVPEAKQDAVESGKALAFELATACGFHVFRATESVVRRYWDHASSGADRPTPPTLGTFAAEMEKANMEIRKLLRP